MAITYHEYRTWARWLNVFTAWELADALGGVPIELGEQGVRALLSNKIIRDLEVEVDGPRGREALYEYIPIPKGPSVRPRSTPPEIEVPRAAGGDPLGVPRGLPVVKGKGGRSSTVGQWRPGRRNMTKAERIKRYGT